jgi:hypothetical protein
MNLGQTMLTAGMLLLLVMSVISANRMVNENTAAQFQAEALTSSASIANDILLEITSKRFDGKPDSAKLVSGTVATKDFSPYDSLLIQDEWGPSASERGALVQPDTLRTDSTYKSLMALNDLDDYDGYQRTVNFGNISGFVVKVKVYYVTAAAPDTRTLTRTNFKRIEVTVEHPLYLTPEPPDYKPKAMYYALISY